MQLYLIRHTTPAVPPGVCYGQSEIDVAASFADEIAAIRAKLTGLSPAACYSSPLQRCARLASALGFGEPRHDERLKELHFGSWEMQAWDTIPRHELDRWGRFHVNEAPPGGETFADLHRRAKEFLHDPTVRQHTGPVLAVTHAGVIRALLAEALNLPLNEAFRFHLDYGSITKLSLKEPMPAVSYVNR